MEKHGIDFEQAQALWMDGDRYEVPLRARDEPRSMLIARWDGRCWAAIVTGRGDKVRLISVRRARKHEVQLYERRDDIARG